MTMDILTDQLVTNIMDEVTGRSFEPSERPEPPLQIQQGSPVVRCVSISVVHTHRNWRVVYSTSTQFQYSLFTWSLLTGTGGLCSSTRFLAWLFN